MRWFAVLVLTLGLGVMGCSETTDPNGTGGDGGIGGDGGSAGFGGDGASGGLGGFGGEAGALGDYIADTPIAVSGATPFDDCEPEIEWLDTETESWVAVNPTNADNFVGVWMQDLGDEPLRGRGNLVGVSFDGGATWDSVAIPGLTTCSDGEFLDTLDPWVAFASNGDVYTVSMMLLPSAILVNKSVDGGLTWNDPVTIATADAPSFLDKPSITGDPDAECSMYAAWTFFPDNQGDPNRTMHFSRTRDCGDTWSEPVLLHDGYGLGLQMVVAPDRSLLAFFRTFEGRYFKRSTDGGETWPGDPTLVAEHVGTWTRPWTPDLSLRVKSGSNLFDVASNPRTGSLYMVWERLFEEATALPLQVAFSESTDGGATWSPAERIDKTPFSMEALLNQAFLPSVAVAGDGTIGVTYYNFENDTVGEPPSSSDHWFIECDPGAADCTDASSWNGPIRLTPDSFDYLTAPVVPSRGLFLGDYVGLAAADDDFVAFFPVSDDPDPARVVSVRVRSP